MSELNESHLISRALEDGLDLREFASELSSRLSAAEKDSVKMFLENAPGAVDLHLKVKKCDDILERVEGMLDGFQAEVAHCWDIPSHEKSQSRGFRTQILGSSSRAFQKYPGISWDPNKSQIFKKKNNFLTLKLKK